MSKAAPASERDRLLPLAILSLVAGAATGLVGALFRLSLDLANTAREKLVNAAHVYGVPGFVAVVAACAAATALAAWLVRRFAPRASGSGIPHVEAVLKEDVRPASFMLMPVKFVGGVLAIGAGLVLGREGPSVQIGASLAHLVGRISGRDWADCRVLMAAGAGAGLATAFNAPIAGAIFVLEELVRRFETRIAIAALGASATAMAVARLLLGEAPEFQIAPLPYPEPFVRVTFFALGVVAGLIAVLYNKAILAALRVVALLEHWPVELRAAFIGAIVGVIAWVAPTVVGGGEALAQQTLARPASAGLLVAIFGLRFLLGPVSYASKTPGGLFAPILALGAQLGVLFAAGCQAIAPSTTFSADAFAVVAMAALFTGVVRAPITGIVLITEMTGSFTMLLPMLGACFAAMLIPTLLGARPIYDSLRELEFPADNRRS